MEQSDVVFPIVVGVMMLVKQLPFLLDNKYEKFLVPVIAVSMSIGIVWLWGETVDVKTLVRTGIVVGLTACGLYDSTIGGIKSLLNPTSSITKRL